VEGHASGDARLRALGTALDAGLRIGDSAYRIGGDEFVILLPELDQEEVVGVAERMRSAGAPPFSWGAASFPEDGAEPTDLLAAADARLYAERRRRRGSA
jgi:diguanylate cyclase (GGDEF)-like protein